VDSARLAIVALAIIALGLLYPLGRLASGSGVGEPCQSSSDCRAFWDAHCMETGTGRDKLSYCTRSCAADRDCPDTWTCGSAVEMKDRAFGDALSMCHAPESAPAPDPVHEIHERVQALLDAGLDVDRSKQRGHVSAMALRLAERARDLHAADLAKACYAIDIAQFDCRDLDRALGEAHAAAAALPAAQRAQLEDSMRALDSAIRKLCARAE
jgi:hypothetical protein